MQPGFPGHRDICVYKEPTYLPTSMVFVAKKIPRLSGSNLRIVDESKSYRDLGGNSS